MDIVVVIVISERRSSSCNELKSWIRTRKHLPLMLTTPPTIVVCFPIVLFRSEQECVSGNTSRPIYESHRPIGQMPKAFWLLQHPIPHS